MGTGFGWLLNGWRLEGRVARAEAATERESKAHQADLAAISNAAAQQVTQALAKQQEAQQAVAELDKKSTKERNDAKAENDRLRARLDAGGRVRVAGNCPTNPVSVPTAARAASLGDGGAVELSPAAGRNVLGIRAGIKDDQGALRTLQQYIRTQCYRPR
ncbi:lysis protein [Pseudomonas oryzihabitans]|uniref:lysis protein n=1 Tax=Pseudomonas oryzihabitans TaxID=47885 RepID=UPI0036405D31